MSANQPHMPREFALEIIGPLKSYLDALSTHDAGKGESNMYFTDYPEIGLTDATIETYTQEADAAFKSLGIDVSVSFLNYPRDMYHGQKLTLEVQPQARNQYQDLVRSMSEGDRHVFEAAHKHAKASALPVKTSMGALSDILKEQIQIQNTSGIFARVSAKVGAFVDSLELTAGAGIRNAERKGNFEAAHNLRRNHAIRRGWQ